MQPHHSVAKTSLWLTMSKAILLGGIAVISSGCGPSIFSVTSPKNNSYINATNAAALSITGNCDSDATSISISGAAATTVSCVNSLWSAQLNLASAADGALSLIATEFRRSGTQPAPISINLTKDTSAPSLAFHWPAPNSAVVPVNAASFQVRGSCSENNSAVIISGAASGTATCSNGNWTVDLDFTNAADGNLTLTAAQTDTAGNSSNQSLSLVKMPECNSTQLDQLATDIENTLSTNTTDVDFSFDVKTEDGRELTYNRGASTMSTPYESASTSKWVSATIILAYMESSANLNSTHPLTLDSHPQDFIDSAHWPIAASDSLSAITLRELLSFTSGLTTEPTCINAALPNGSFSGCVTAIANANAGNGKTPGAEFWYSSNHLQVAGMMAINARNIALGITSSSWQDLVTDFKSSTGLFPNSQYNLPSQSNPRLAGGMTWTGVDYLQFIAANFNKEILSATPVAGQTQSYQEQQLSDQIANASIGNSPALAGIQEDWHYGFGLWLECHATPFNCGYGVDSYSSPGAYGAYPFMNLTNKFYGIIARQGALGTFRNGYALYSAVQTKVIQWAAKSCPP